MHRARLADWLPTRRVVVIVVTLVFALAALAVAAVRSSTGGCSAAAPIPTLTPQLRALGGFDQPLDPGQEQLDDAAARAAAAVGVDLSGVVAGHPVAERAVAPASHDALVVPLVRPLGSEGGATQVVGLVAFLRDCSGRAYFDTVDDLARNVATTSLATDYPRVDVGTAQQRLGAPTHPDLIYTDSPFAPSWRARDGPRTIPAT